MEPPVEWVISRERVHEALVSEADFVAAQRMGLVAPPHRLVGWVYRLARCGVCGRRMESCWVHGRAGYRCRQGHSSGKVASPQWAANPLSAGGCDLGSGCEADRGGLLGESHPVGWSAVVQQYATAR